MSNTKKGALAAEGATATAENSGTAALQLLEMMPDLVNQTVLRHPEELVVLSNRSFGYAVEPQRTWMLFLLSALRKEALRLGLIIRVRGEDREGGGRVFSTRTVTVESPDGTVWLEGVGTGEDASQELLTAWNPHTRQRETTGEVVLKENAARAAETRALKRAIEVLGSGELAAAFVRLSQVAEQLANQVNPPGDARAITAALHEYLRGKRNGGNGNGNASKAQATTAAPAPAQPEVAASAAAQVPVAKPRVPRVAAKATYTAPPPAPPAPPAAPPAAPQVAQPAAPAPPVQAEQPAPTPVVFPEAPETLGF